SSDNNEPWDDLRMNKDNHVALISEQWGVEKQTTSVKNKSFLKNSIRTQQRHAKALKDAAVGSSKITDFFNVKASSGEDQPDELSDDGDPEYGWENAINSVEQALESPNLANELKSKLMAIGMYFRHLSNGEKKIEASEIVAVSLGWTKNYKSRCIRAWANQWIQNKTIPTSNRGKYPKTKSLWKHEDIAAQIGSYIRSNKLDITPKKLTSLSAAQKRELCEVKKNNPSLSNVELARQYNIGKATVTDILSEKERWLAITIEQDNLKKFRGPKWPLLERALNIW
ncbi:13560_t:CDS:2, partial [Entrophospora sp. SA101]